MFHKTMGVAAAAAALAAAGAPAHAQDAYPQPTRGMLLERGGVIAPRNALVELNTGGDELETGGGVRLGLPNSELLLNSSLASGDGASGGNEAVLKWSMGNLDLGAPAPVRTAVYGGVSHVDVEDGTDYTNFAIGAAMTMETAQYIVNLNPEVVSDDESDDTIVQLGFGAHYKLATTAVGTFHPGAELLFISADENDTVLALGTRWIYSERLTLDLVPVVLSDRNVVGIPGFVRVSAAF